MGDISAELKGIVEERFALGPIVDRDFWNGKRASMAIDRGPCRFEPFTFVYDYILLMRICRGKPAGLSDSDS